MSEVYRDGRLIERHDDTTRTVTTYDETGAVTSTRPYTAAENEAADAAIADAARLDDHEQRLARIEAHLWLAAPEDAPTTTAPTLAERGGIWPAGTLLSDGGKVWRNATTVPLTTAPSGFPGQPSQWTHLFVEHGGAAEPEPEPGHPEGYVGTWSAAADYKVGDVVDRDGTYYRAKVAHGAAYAGTWGPPLPSVWDDLGPA